jgi:hypothetical protein
VLAQCCFALPACWSPSPPRLPDRPNILAAGQCEGDIATFFSTLMSKS